MAVFLVDLREGDMGFRKHYNSVSPSWQSQEQAAGRDVKLRIPNPHGEDVGPALLKEILKQAGVTDEQWRGSE